MESLTFEEMTEPLLPGPETGFVIIQRLSAALGEYLDEVTVEGEMAGVEDFCCYVHNAAAEIRDREWSEKGMPKKGGEAHGTSNIPT